MTTPKHTPAPWFIVDVGSGASIHASNFDICRLDSFIVCSDSVEKQNKANAKLIAAAPELLEALIELSTAVTFKSETVFFNDVECFEARIPIEFVDKARTAITKATQ